MSASGLLGNLLDAMREGIRIRGIMVFCKKPFRYQDHVATIFKSKSGTVLTGWIKRSPARKTGQIVAQQIKKSPTTFIHVDFRVKLGNFLANDMALDDANTHVACADNRGVAFAMGLPNFNTIAMGFLFTIFVVLGVSFISELAFHADKPEVSGYNIEVAEATGGGGAEEPVKQAIGPLLANADIDAGKKVAKRCTACHTFDDGGANKVGPALWNVVNRDMGAVEGFGYSSSLTEYGTDKKWTYDELDGFLTKPTKWIKGTAMGFAGLKKIDDRANLIAYIRAQAAEPAPLPTE